MKRAWAVALVALASCNAYAPVPEAPSPSVGQNHSVTPEAPVAGASNPKECEEAPPQAIEQLDDAAFVDGALAGLDRCGKKLAKSGNVAVSLVVGAKGAVEGVYVTRSTVRDCQVVECVKTQLSRAPAAEPRLQGLHNVELELIPRERPRRTTSAKWPDVAESRYCADPEDALNQYKHGRLPPEQIQAVIRGRYSVLRRCYEAGLARNPELRGKVSARFVIRRDGRVSGAHILANEVRDCRVAQCVRDEITKCVFPNPEGGVVTVVYPVMFEPG